MGEEKFFRNPYKPKLLGELIENIISFIFLLTLDKKDVNIVV